MSLFVTLYASRVTSLSFDELASFGAIDQGEELVKRVASYGVSELGAPDVGARLSAGVPALFCLLSAWAKLSIGRVFDPLTSMRLPWLLLAASAPLSVYAIVSASRSGVVSVMAAASLLFLPRWLHGAAVASEGVLVASLWLALLALYVRSQVGRKKVCWAVAGALLFGIGAALSLATLWVLLLIIVHFALARGSWRGSRSGRVPLPSIVVASLPLAPLTFFATSPIVWRVPAAAIVRHLLSPLSPAIVPTQFHGRMVNALPVPGSYALSWLVATLPFSLQLAALVGLLAIVHRALARRFASGALRPPRDRMALGMLCTLGLGLAIGLPAIAPEPLVRFPPRVELAYPFVAIAVALGLERLGQWVRPERLRLVPAACVLGVLALGSITTVSTAGASFDPLFGGARRVAHSGSFPVGDGSELGPLLAAIDERGGVELSAGVPPGLFQRLLDLGRIKTAEPPASDVRLEPRPRPNASMVASVRRDGIVLWALVEKR